MNQPRYWEFASRTGVDIDLIVRGACALRPNRKDVSYRIRARSIVGWFLEHSWIFYFANGSEPDIYLGSDGWMPRNLYERVGSNVSGKGQLPAQSNFRRDSADLSSRR